MVRGIYNPVTHQRRPPDEFLHVSSKALLLPQRLRRKTLWGLGVRRTRAAHGIWAVNNVNKDGFLGKIWKEWTSLCVFFPKKKWLLKVFPLQTLGDVRWVQTIDFPHEFSIISRHMHGCPPECGGRSSKNTSYFDVPSWPLTSSLELGCGDPKIWTPTGLLCPKSQHVLLIF